MRLIPLPVLLCLMLPLTAQAEDTTTDETPVESATVNVGDEKAELKPADGLAECAAILEVASARSSNLIERRNMQNAALIWLNASDSAAEAEGIKLDDVEWNDKVDSWLTRIESVDALSRNADWMSYCAEMGREHGIGSEIFESFTS